MMTKSTTVSTTPSHPNHLNITIFEFSRQLLEPQWSSRFNQYVSTGFDKEIGFETQPVPSEIQDARPLAKVFRGIIKDYSFFA
jgi:hypothetical protein